MSRAHPLVLSTFALLLAAPPALAGKYGFADKEGGGKNDPIIKVFGSTGPNLGKRFSLSEEEANELYQVDPTTIGSGNATYALSSAHPLIPAVAGANQWIYLEFPMKIHKKKVRKTLFKNKAALAPQSFLTNNIEIVDENDVHLPGIALVNGRDKSKTKLTGDANLPIFIDNNGKNRLVSKDVFAYVSDSDGDGTLNDVGVNPSGFADGGANEVRVKLHSVGGVTVNGYWVLKIGAAGAPTAPGNPTIVDVSAKTPVTPAATAANGNQKVEPFSSFFVRYSEPVVPVSVGFNAKEVQQYNATNPVVPLLYNGNTALVPNPDNLNVPLYPNFQVMGVHKDADIANTAPFVVPFDVRPRNPNNLAEYVINPLLDLPGGLDVSVASLTSTNNVNVTSLASGDTVTTAAMTFWNELYDDAAPMAFAFRTEGTRAFVNVPVAPQAIYYAPLSGSGAGAINLDGNGFETNKPATEKILILTNLMQLTTCPIGGSFLFGCNPNTFGDATAMDPIGLGGNPAGLMGPTPVPGVNEGSKGSDASGLNPNALFGEGFETVCRDSNGDQRLAKSPVLGSISDIQVGDFLDKIFFDALNPFAQTGAHQSFTSGAALTQNSIADPPSPNPPPLRLPVGLQPPDIVFNAQNLKEPAFVIEGDECFTTIGPGLGRIFLLPNNTTPLAGDRFPTFGQNGPSYQSFSMGGAYAARQQIGNFLYMADRDNGVVQVVNSNNFSVVHTIETPDPEGLGLSPDLRTLYVSNFGDDSVSIVGVDPISPFYNVEINRIKVGSGPRDVAVQPEHEDVFIANYLGNSISILNPLSQTIRRTINDQIKRPWEIVLTPRLLATGWGSGIYFGYIANQQTGDILVYESGPSGATGIGADAIRWSAALSNSLTEMRGICYDPGNYPGTVVNLPTGVYITHRDQDSGLSMITRVAFTTQLPGFGTFPPVPLPSTVLNAPGTTQRRFEVVGTWGGPLVPLQQQVNFGGQDQIPYDVALNDFTAADFFALVPGQNGGAGVQTNLGSFASTPSPTAGGVNSKNPLRNLNGTWFQTWFPDRLYVSFPGDNLVQVLNATAAGTVENTVKNVPVPGRLAVFFDQ